MNKGEYFEKVVVGKFLTAVIGMFSIITGGLIIFAVMHNFTSATSLFAGILAIPLLAILLFLASFYNMKITITSKELILKYSFFRKHLLLQEIKSCEHIKTKFRNHGGLGVRTDFNKSTAYLTFFGNAVKINTMEEKIIIFSTNQPNKVCRIISTKNHQTTL